MVAVYTEFSKAFDKLNQDILLKKLAEAGVHGILLRYICSYMRNRSQAVTVKGYRSEFFRATSGIPQGSHLDPLLFVIYINDLVDSFKSSNVLLYADDFQAHLFVIRLSQLAVSILKINYF